MEELQKILTSVWSEWIAEELLGEGTFGKVYKIRREFLGREQFSALKVIRISQNKTNSGFSFSMEDKSFVDEIVSEIELMAKFRGNSNIVSYEDHKVIEETDGSGWTILIRMELLTPLSSYLEKNDITEETVIKLGKDISKALVTVNKHNIIHRDIKLENIFVSENGDFKLGDFGTARIIERTVDNRTKTGTYMYMAPEVMRSEPYGAKADIYSLGILMYYMLNHQRFPFFPSYPEPIKFEDYKTAFNKRISGEAIAPPDCENKKLVSIVLKACEFDSENRFKDAGEMNLVLETVYAEGTMVVVDDYISQAPPEKENVPAKKPNKKRMLIIPAVLFAVVLIIGIFVLGGTADNEAEKVRTEGILKYTVCDDGIHIMGLVEECDSLSIPAEIDGKAVVAIDAEAFANRTFSSVQLPDTVKTIGSGAFINCRNLSSIDLPEEIKSIEARAFEKCSALVTVEVPQNLETIGDMAFKDCISLLNISVPAGLKNVGSDVFAYTPYTENRKDMFDDYSYCLSKYSDSKYTLLDINGDGPEELLIFGTAKDEHSFFGNYHKYMLAVYDCEYGVTHVNPESDLDYETYFDIPEFTVTPFVSSLKNIYNNYEKLYYSATDKCLYGCTNDDGYEEIYKISLVDGIYIEELYKESSYVGSNPTVPGEEIIFSTDVNDISYLEETVMRGIDETSTTEE